jgi:hypothetical protein
VQDLLKPSIRLKEDSPTYAVQTLMGEGGLKLMLGTLLDEGGLAPTSEANLGTPARPIGHAQEPRIENVAITRRLGSDMDWRKLISEYLRLVMIPHLRQ